jgi:nitroreductase
VYAPDNVRTAALAIAIVCPRAFDTGRAAQNIMLAAWGEGVVSCPNGISDAQAAERLVGGPPAIVLSFGYPEKPRDPESRPAEEWSRRANRKPLDEVSRRI